MSETFALDWLALRAAPDARARSPQVVDALRHWRVSRGRLRVCDLGAGSGSQLRFLAPRLGGQQDWLLLDHDGGLLAAASEGLPSDEAGVATHVRTAVCDFSLPWSIPRFDADLVTCSALLDLVSRPWLAAFAERVREAGAAVYCSLNYAGSVAIDPEDADDERIIAAFNDHQRGNKGFGPALGPQAAHDLQARLLALGYAVMMARSDWVIGRDEAVFAGQLLEGIAGAAQALGVDSADWLARRKALLGRRRSVIRVAHFDVLGLPGAS